MSKFSTHLATACAFLVAVLTVPCTAAAEPIRLRPVSGTISLGPSASTIVDLDIAGKGFSLVAFADNSIFDPGCEPCEIGLAATSVNFSAALVGPFSGSLTYQGRTLPLGRGTEESDDIGTLSLSVPLVIGPASGDVERISFTAPFSFGGSLLADVDPVTLLPTREFFFHGGGIATGSLSLFTFPETGTRDLFFEGAVFQFKGDPAPVPEPGSLLLAATGICVVTQRVRAGRRRGKAL
jgi:hypothetical protein